MDVCHVIGSEFRQERAGLASAVEWPLIGWVWVQHMSGR